MRGLSAVLAIWAGSVQAQAVDPVALVEQCGGYRMALEIADADLAATQEAAGVIGARLGAGAFFGLAALDAVTARAGGEIVIHRAGRASLGVDPAVLLRAGGQLDVYLGLDLQADETAGPGQRVFADPDNGSFLLTDETPLIADIGILAAEATVDHLGSVAVSFTFDAPGTAAFSEATGQNIGRILALVLDDELLTAPRIMDQISGGRGLITGSFTLAEAESLALVLSAGLLAYSPVIISEMLVEGASPETPPCNTLSVQEE